MTTTGDDKRRKLAKKALKLKWKKGISLASAWKQVKPKLKDGKKKRPSSSKTGTKVGRPRSKTTTTRKKTSTTSSSKSSRPKTKAVVNGKERTIYTGRSGGKYYKSKGTKHYLT